MGGASVNRNSRRPLEYGRKTQKDTLSRKRGIAGEQEVPKPKRKSILDSQRARKTLEKEKTIPPILQRKEKSLLLPSTREKRRVPPINIPGKAAELSNFETTIEKRITSFNQKEKIRSRKKGGL